MQSSSSRRVFVVGIFVSSLFLPTVLHAQSTRTGEKKSGPTAAKTRNQQRRKQKQKQPKKKKPGPFRWVNPLKHKMLGVRHATFVSPSMKKDVGYVIYLPPGYDTAANQAKRYPVVYYLHGGRPGSELKSVKLSKYLLAAMNGGVVDPMIYVFVNGGPVSHYDMPNRPDAQGASVFIRELIPHIDKTYRTIADRSGRGLEGFSQGGRGTTRLMFRYPELFCSAAPGGAGHATEKKISEDNGRESENLVFAPGDNTYDLARKYAARKDAPALRILIHVGTAGFNYENNLAYMKFLDELGIRYEKLIVPDAPHSAAKIYDAGSLKLMRFHAANFEKALSKGSQRGSK